MPPPDLLNDERQKWLVDEMAVSEFLLWFGDMEHVAVPVLKLRDLHDALVTKDSETLCSLLLSLTLAAIPHHQQPGDKVMTANRWRLLCDDYTWPEVLRRLVSARHYLKLEPDSARDAANLLAEMDPMAVGRDKLLVILRSLTDAVLEQDPIKGLLDRRNDEAEMLAKDRAQLELEDRRKRRGGRWGRGESEDDDYDSDNDQLAALREEEDSRVAIRTSPLGEDRHKRRYWWGLGGHPGPLYVEMIDGSWGQVTTKQKLDAIIKALNTKGIRELQLKQSLEAKYPQIVHGMNRSQHGTEFDRDDQATMPSLRLPKPVPKPPAVREGGKSECCRSHAIHRALCRRSVSPACFHTHADAAATAPPLLSFPSQPPPPPMDGEEMMEMEPEEPPEPFGPWEDHKVLAEAADIAKQTVENFARVGLQFTVAEAAGAAAVVGPDDKSAQDRAVDELVQKLLGFASADELKRLVLEVEEEIFKVADPPTREPNKPMPDFDDENEDLPGASSENSSAADTRWAVHHAHCGGVLSESPGHADVVAWAKSCL